MRFRKYITLGLVVIFLIAALAISLFRFNSVKAGEFTEATVALFSDASPAQHTVEELPILVSELQQIPLQSNGWTIGSLQTAGDMEYIGYSETNTTSALNTAGLGSLPTFWSYSNHHMDNSYDLPMLHYLYDLYPAWNVKPGPDGIKSTYSYDVGEMHIAVLNEYFDGVGETNIDGDITDSTFNWLKSDLRSSTKSYKFVVAHEPAYPNMRHLGDSLDQYPEHRDRFWNLLKTERVIGFISGHDHYSHITEYDGVYQIDTGVLRPHIWSDDNFATLTYLHNDTDNNLSIRQVQDLSTDWTSTNINTKTRSDFANQVLVNTANNAGSRGYYWVDYDDTVSSNPDWSTNNNGRWWQNSFDPVSASWSQGELGIGYDSTDIGNWRWINTQINPDPNSSGANHVHAIFQRIPFTVYNKNLYNQLLLDLDYDDGVTVWLNGTVVYRSSDAVVFDEANYSNAFNQINSVSQNAAGDDQINPVFTQTDITQYLSSVSEGNNVLVIANWNSALVSTDLVAGAKLTLYKNTDPAPTPTETPIPTETPVSNNSQNSSNNNASHGIPEPPKCTDRIPLSHPDLFKIYTTKGSAKIFFTPVNENITDYAIVYGFKKDDERFAVKFKPINNNQGEQNFTINHLNPKSTYYFKVMAYNGCVSSPASDWIPAKPDRKKEVHKYKTVLKNKVKTLINQF